MQGSYKDNGLPRPYYMKPSKRGSAYDKMPRLVFLTNLRKLTGYILMLALFGLCVYLVGQELRPQPDTTYELMLPDTKQPQANIGDVGKFVDSTNDKAAERVDLSLNKVQNSKGEFGHAVLEAPKGGLVNEGPIVGNDEGLVIDGKKTKADADTVPTTNDRVKASRNDLSDPEKLNGAAKAAANDAKAKSELKAAAKLADAAEVEAKEQVVAAEVERIMDETKG